MLQRHAPLRVLETTQLPLAPLSQLWREVRACDVRILDSNVLFPPFIAGRGRGFGRYGGGHATARTRHPREPPRTRQRRIGGGAVQCWQQQKKHNCVRNSMTDIPIKSSAYCQYSSRRRRRRRSSRSRPRAGGARPCSPAVACVLVTLKTRSRGTHSTECDYSTESTKKKTHIAHFSVLVPGAYF